MIATAPAKAGTRAIGSLPVAEHLRPVVDNWCVASADSGVTPVLELVDAPDESGLRRWRWFAVTDTLALGDAWMLPIEGEA